MIRAGVFLVPIIAALASSLVLRWVLPKPEGLFQTIVWVIAIALPATLVLKGVELLSRKILPLAALLGMSLIFPDQAPSRLTLARKSGRVRDPKLELVQMKAAGSG